MDGKLQVLLTTLMRLFDFLRAHPIGDEPADRVVTVFGEKVARIKVLVAQQQDGTLDRAARSRQRRALRREITQLIVQHLGGVAVSLEGEWAQIAAAIRQPLRGKGYTLFLAAVQSIAVLIKEHHDLLRSHGMAEDTPQALNDLIAAFQQAQTEANAGLRAHTGARAELKELSREMTRMVRQLEGIVLWHFRDNPEVIGAWKSARNVAWPVGEVVKPAVKVPVKEDA